MITFDRKDRSNESLREIYVQLLRPRLIEEKMVSLLRQGKVSKWFSGIGQEAISVGTALALEPEEFILPVHRNLGVFTVRGVPISRLLEQFRGTLGGFTKGRDRSFHFGSPEHHIIGMISHLGAQLGVADGIALAHRLDKAPHVTVAFSGDGGSSEGDFHEALNVAAVWKLPVLFVIENNGYGLSTPNSEQFAFDSFTAKGPAYGMEAHSIDGNNVLEVLDMAKALGDSMRKDPRPILLEALTFRIRGHEEASGTKYVPEETLQFWSARDPIANYEQYLLTEQVLDQSQVRAIRSEIKAEIDEAVALAFDQPPIIANRDVEEQDVYAPSGPTRHLEGDALPPGREMRFVDAIRDGLTQSMQQYPELVLMGQDIGGYGGVFKVTEGLMDAYGADRVRNTPLCESAILGASLGLSIMGKKSMVEMQFADFVSCGFNQIANNLAKSHYRWGQAADVVIRMPTGAGVGAGPFHSQSTEAWFAHIPGLKIVYPSNPKDAKGLLCAAMADPNPYLFFEHKYLYRSISGSVPEGFYTTAVGQAWLVSEGYDLTVITYGLGVHWALNFFEASRWKPDIIDLRTLIPWDKEAVMKSVEKTSRVLILHEDCQTGGFGAEIAAYVSEHGFEYLDAPVMRLGALDTPVPFASPLERNFLPLARLEEQVKALMNY